MSPASTLIEGATVLVGPALDPLATGALLVQGERIAWAGVGRDPDEEVERVDARGLLLAPGFIDAHVHIGFCDPADVVAGGVTTVRDLAWPPHEIWPLVASSRDAAFAGPTIVAAGQMLTVEGGYPTLAAWAPPGTGLVVDDEDDAQTAVEGSAQAGACAIKVALNAAAGPTFDAALLEAVVHAAHAAGLRVTGHIYGLDELRKAIDAGVDELAHILMSPEIIPDELVAAMVARGMAVVPTLSIFFERDRRVAIQNTARFIAAGGTVVYGTDLGNEGPRPGIDAREVSAMREAGMSARNIIECATVRAASWIGLENCGVIEAGRDADLVAFDERALDDPDFLARPLMVWRRGRRVL